ncbi:WD40/YVTN/BNR-like repeat-containing protein [Piscinibacter gummiphilus]|uniref:Uncharacterized protein n=1 Tax=Piscinibacter gummiphilus TaxID=946333 RepID=A0A1W6L442_9BURK|nr:hypothetical protein [Piscinibacter gummiphilus]ARN18976.1 hypothetical protein A4W93_03055 [Piscinibacter gummiphilus]ATU63621.1 hypothetical protein CPZ87_03130 [Piscinibacter gummiphilus]GLS92763.1 hypothetical protein GCM10007918_00540 [Piscinibacter gummiphilus]
MGPVHSVRAWARRLGSVFLVVALVGCASVNQVRDPAKSPPRAGESVVVLSLTGNTAQVTALDEITVRQVNQVAGSNVTILHVLNQVSKGVSRDTSLFAGVLPEGEYEFTVFRNHQTQRFLNLNESMRQRIGKFTVRNGQPVDLGRLILTPVNQLVVVGRSTRVTSNVPLMRRFAPDQMKFFEGELSSGWNTARGDNDRVEEYALQRPVGADHPVELADGRIAAASRLGSVLIRDDQGRWRPVRSDTLDSFLYVMPGHRSDTTLLAVGEFGALMRLPAGSDKLEPLDSGDLPAGNLLFIAGDERAGWYIGHQKDKTLTLFHSAQLEGGRWSPLRQETVGFDFWNGANSIWFWRRPGGFSYAVSEGSIHTLDFASGAWSMTKAPNGNRLVSVEANPNGSIGILTSPGGGFAGIFASLYLSEDLGQHWQEVKPEFKVKVAPPRQLASGTLLVMGGVFGTPELQASQDGGRTWQHRAPFALDRRLVVLPSGALLTVDSGQFGLFSVSRSTDDGATWRVEYSNYDARAAQATAKK